MDLMIELVLVVASVGAFWFVYPKKGKRHWLLDVPLMAALAPLVVVSAIAIGATMMLPLH